MADSIMVIRPRYHQGTWVFNDEIVGLNKESLAAGVPGMIDDLVKDIPQPGNGFRLLFSATPFAGYQRELLRIKEEHGGYRYRIKNQPAECWLCASLFIYFGIAPETLYVMTEEL